MLEYKKAIRKFKKPLRTAKDNAGQINEVKATLRSLDRSKKPATAYMFQTPRQDCTDLFLQQMELQHLTKYVVEQIPPITEYQLRRICRKAGNTKILSLERIPIKRIFQSGVSTFVLLFKK